MIKRIGPIGCVLAAAPPPQIVHDVPVINIEVPVRVFQDNRFVDSLRKDIFSAFSEITKATGGLSDTSASAELSFKRLAAAAENYYLLYYRPARFKPDGKFREISVRVKSKGFRVSHRSGYIAE